MTRGTMNIGGDVNVGGNIRINGKKLTTTMDKTEKYTAMCFLLTSPTLALANLFNWNDYIINTTSIAILLSFGVIVISSIKRVIDEERDKR